ncbi:MAG: hypothetical protein ABSH20_08270 [Tepidisphaeraceae bacterium]|jgi:hypothetical protein
MRNPLRRSIAPSLRRFGYAAIISLAWLLPPLAVRAADVTVRAADGKTESFIRFLDDNDGGGKLQTAIATFKNKAGVKVHLVAAVHVADSPYYKDLGRTFEKYDALLYEMVKPGNVDVPAPDKRRASAVSFIQQALKDVLELDYQLDAIDYAAKNFVHADLTAEEFERLQSERGESIFMLIFQQMLREMDNPRNMQASDLTIAELLVALTSPDRARHLKLMLAKQFDNIEDQLSGLDGPNGTVLVTERNKAAIAVLKKTIAKGQRNIGIFYGAAHMKGISKMLAEMGFEPAGIEWRTAWDMTPRPGDIVVKQAKPVPATAPTQPK